MAKSCVFAEVGRPPPVSWGNQLSHRNSTQYYTTVICIMQRVKMAKCSPASTEVGRHYIYIYVNVAIRKSFNLIVFKSAIWYFCRRFRQIFDVFNNQWTSFDNLEMENDQELTRSTAMKNRFKNFFSTIEVLYEQKKIDSTEKFLSDLFPGLEPSSLETIQKATLQKVQKALQEIDDKTA